MGTIALLYQSTPRSGLDEDAGAMLACIREIAYGLAAVARFISLAVLFSVSGGNARIRVCPFPATFSHGSWSKSV